MLTPTLGKGKYGSDLVVDLMQRYEIPYVALNPGSTFRGLHDSIVNYGGNQPQIVLAQHEKVAVQIAHGYAKATGRPMAAIAHDTVGLLHATNAIYYAYLDRAPVIVMGATGPMDTTRRRPHIDWIHTTVLQGQAVRDYVKWDRQPVNAQEVIDSITRVHNDARQRWQEEARKDWDVSPTAVPRLACEIWDAIKGTDWVLTANPLQGWTYKLWDFDTPERHPGNSLGTATQIGISLGVALAYKGSGKLVVDIQPDGDLMYDAGALWIAAQMRIPMLAVMFNNRAYYNDWEHQLRIAEHRGRPLENAWVGQAINDPPPDFAGLARSLGWYAEGPIEDPEAIAPALQRAIKQVQAGRPALLDTITQFD